MQQPMFNWEAGDKYSKLKNFIQEKNYKFESYKMLQTERITVTKNWLVRKGLHFLETLTEAEKERCNMTDVLFNTLFKIYATI